METRHHLMAWPAVSVVLLDQLSKAAVLHKLPIHESVTVVAGFFDLVHVRNRGMAFGLLNRPDVDFGYYFLVVASILAISAVLVWHFRHKEERAQITLGLSLILGGAAGNLTDRLRFGEVIDFLDVHLGSYHWPAFNVADSAITAGTFLVVLHLLFTIRDG